MNTSIQAFKDEFLSDATATMTTSAAIRVQGNRVELAATLRNVTGTSVSVVFSLEGSYDGKAWHALTSVDSAAFDYSTAAYGGDGGSTVLDHAFIRVTVTISGTDPFAGLFDVAVAFSSQ